jgi:hypothetical protein
MNADYYLNLPEEERKEYDALKKASVEVARDLQVLPDRADTENDLSTHIKLEINNLIWMYAAETTTLKDAEAMASRWWLELMENRNK